MEDRVSVYVLQSTVDLLHKTDPNLLGYYFPPTLEVEKKEVLIEDDFVTYYKTSTKK